MRILLLVYVVIQYNYPFFTQNFLNELWALIQHSIK